MDWLHRVVFEVWGALAGAAVTRDTVLEGGPYDGQIVFATDQFPIIMFDQPRPPNLFEVEAVKKMPVAVWHEKRKWYEPKMGA